MSTDLVKVVTSEHWLTMMMCSACEKIPDDSPMYKCEMGHFMCKDCFAQLNKRGFFPKCGRCYSLELTKHVISTDFLRKLRVKPGIGRSRRYRSSYWPFSTESSDKRVVKNEITVEKLFQLSQVQIKQLFGMKKTHSRVFALQNRFERGDIGDDLDKTFSNALVSKVSLSEFRLSKKPITCPHGLCRKMVTISSFAQHFKYDHPEIRFHLCSRGEELHLPHDVQIIKYNWTQCVAVIGLNNSDQTDTYWLMVTGSPYQEPWRAYVLYWLLTNSTSHPNCAIDLSSHLDNISYSTFCPITRIYDNFYPSDVFKTLKCLYVARSSMCNILSEGPQLHLRIIIY